MAMSEPRVGAQRNDAWAQSVQFSFRFLLLAVCLAALGWMISNVRQVPADSRAVVLRFGNVVREQGAGLLIAWPRPIEQVAIVPSADRQIELKISRFDAPAIATSTTGFEISYDPRKNAGFLLTGDSSIVYLQATLFYRIVDPAAYVLSQDHVIPALERLFVASAVAVCAGRDLDTILVARPELDTALTLAARAGREALRADLMNAVNRRLMELGEQGAGLGITVGRVDLAASIPSAAKSAFDYVLIASQRADRDTAEARTKAATTAQKANQQRDRVITDADARAAERVATAKARTAAIAALTQGEPGLSGPMLMNRIYYDRIGAVLGKAARVDTVDGKGGINLILPGSQK